MSEGAAPRVRRRKRPGWRYRGVRVVARRVDSRVVEKSKHSRKAGEKSSGRAVSDDDGAR